MTAAHPIARRGEERPRLYDRGADPRELADRGAEEERVVTRFDRLLAQRLKEDRRLRRQLEVADKPLTSPIPEDELERLRALGYVD